MTFLLPFTFLLLTLILIIVGIVLIRKECNEDGEPLVILSLIPMILFLMSLVFHSTEKEDLAYIHVARQRAEYIEAGVVHDLDEYADFCKQVANANNKILKAREKKDNIWIGYCYFKSVANQELITVNFDRNE